MSLGDGLYVDLGEARSAWYRGRCYQSMQMRVLQYDLFWLALAEELEAAVPNRRAIRRLYYALRWLERYPGHGWRH